MTLKVLNADVDTLANNLKEVLHATAEEDLGRQRKKIQPLITNEVLDSCDQKLQMKQQEYTSTEARLEYRKANRKARKKMKAAKEEWIEEQYKNIEGNAARKQQRGPQCPRDSQPRFSNTCLEPSWR